MLESLDPLFRPRAVAVVGASRERGTIGGEIFHNMLTCGFPGPVYPVHPKATVVQSVHAYRSIGEVPQPVDLAVLVVPGKHVLETARACVEHGVKALIVISAGFAETGPAGKAAQDELLRLCREHGVRMVGPNCLGVIATDSACPLNATFVPSWPPEGEVSFSSQSGALGLAIIEYASDLGIGVRHFVSVGNKADVSGNDLLEYWEDDERTRTILLYLESFGNPQRFLQIARRVSRKKPIIAVKSGRTVSGARAATSHTGALAGQERAVDAILRQAGVIRTDTIEQLFDTAMLLTNQPVPKGRRVGIITNAGGPGIMASDALESQGLLIPALSDDTQAALRELLPAEAAVRNPVDMIASATAESYRRAVELVLADENIDAILVLFVPPIITEADAVAAAIVEGSRGTDKPVLTGFIGKHGIPQAVSALRQARFPSYAFPEAAAMALSRAVQYGEWLRRPAGSLEPLANVDAKAAAAVIERAEPGWLPSQEVTRLLDAYGIPQAGSRFARSAAQAAQAAEQLGYPVAMKLDAEALVHKSDLGGVALDLQNPQEVMDAYRRMSEQLEQSGHGGSMRGVLLQQMVRGGVETYVGATRDAAFGLLVGFGLGGINVELWQDVVFRFHPLTDVDAEEMVGAIRGKKLLDGFRGAPAVDKPALAELLRRVSQLIGDCPRLVELDLNPAMALPEGEGVRVVDARIRLA